MRYRIETTDERLPVSAWISTQSAAGTLCAQMDRGAAQRGEDSLYGVYDEEGRRIVPMNAVDTVTEALREYVGDGDGADQQVLMEYDETIANAAVVRYRRQQRRVIVVVWCTIAINLVASTLTILSRA